MVECKLSRQGINVLHYFNILTTGYMSLTILVVSVQCLCVQRVARNTVVNHETINKILFP